MSVILALEHAYTAVSTFFTENNINAVNVFGWREVDRYDRDLPGVVWTPGDESGSLGELGGARNPGQDVRPLANLGELFTVHFVAFDPREPESELAQYRCARMLYEIWYVAMYGAACGTFRVRSQKWVRGQTTIRSFGAVLRAVVEVQAPLVEALPDEPLVGEAYAGQSDTVGITDVTHELTVKLNEETDT